MDMLCDAYGNFSRVFPTLLRLVLDKQFGDCPRDQHRNIRTMRVIFDKPKLEAEFADHRTLPSPIRASILP